MKNLFSALRIQVSQEVYERLMNCPDIEFNRRGSLTIPKAQDISVYWAAWADDDDISVEEEFGGLSNASSPTPSLADSRSTFNPSESDIALRDQELEKHIKDQMK